jgi:hypothetical protein
MANSGTAGYFHLGYTTDSTTTINKFAFPGDTRSTLGTGLATATFAASGMAHSGTAGYIGGGVGPLSTVNKFAFPSDTRTTLATGLSSARYYTASFANSGVI